MITQKHRKVLKKALGKFHIDQIMKFIELNGILRSDLTPYSKDDISKVFNGRENLELETAIIDAAEHYAFEKKKQEEYRLQKINKIKNATI